MRRAVIDIGTNSVKLLVAEVEGAAVFPLWEESEQTRLGQGFYKDRQLQPATIQHTARAVARFAATAREWKADPVRAFATSAVRDAVNQADLLQVVQTASGVPVEVISGDQEADWAFAGVRTDPALAAHPLLILDVGGGSSEFILGRGAHPEFRQSFRLGTVRLLEQIQPSDPPLASEWERCRQTVEGVLQEEVKPQLDSPLALLAGERVLLVGTGGTTSILAAMELGLRKFDREQIERVRLSRPRVWQYQEQLWGQPLAERQRFPGLPPNRADVILFGVAIFALVLEVFGLDEVRVSTRGLRFAAVMASKEKATAES